MVFIREVWIDIMEAESSFWERVRADGRCGCIYSEAGACTFLTRLLGGIQGDVGWRCDS